jgi:outer membrane protein assembly factor BamB
VDLFPWDKPDPVHWLNSYATPTPVVEPGRLYCDYGTFGTAAIDADTGKDLWKRRLPLDHQVGPGSSPIVVKDLLVLVRDGRDQQYVTALDKRTGETVWKSDRPRIDATTGDFRKCFSTPLLVEVGGRTQMVVTGPQWIVSYEPETGKELWRVNDGNGFSAAPRPVYGNGMAYVSTGNTGGSPQLWAIRVPGAGNDDKATGDITATHVAWKLTAGIPMMPSPILVGTDLYVLSDNGFVSRVDALSGKVEKKQRAGGNHCASPVWAEGRLYCFRESLAENPLDGAVFASPAFVGSAIYLRTDTHLYCIREAARSAP